MLFGRLASNGRVARHRPMLDFFDALKHFCQSRLVPVAKLFQTYDDRQQGRDEEKHASPSLSEAQFSRMVRETLLPAVSSAELAYLHAMLDADGGERVSRRSSNAPCWSARGAARTSLRARRRHPPLTSSCASGRVSRVNTVRASPNISPRAHPENLGAASDGLDAKQLAAVVEEEFPGIERADVRCALASLRSADLDGDGLVSLPELRRAIRLAVTGRVVPGEGSVDRTPTEKFSSPRTKTGTPSDTSNAREKKTRRGGDTQPASDRTDERSPRNWTNRRRTRRR